MYFSNLCYKKDTQQEHTLPKLAAAATSYVCQTIHSGKIIPLTRTNTLENLPE